jgi:hypothetical protein
MMQISQYAKSALIRLDIGIWANAMDPRFEKLKIIQQAIDAATAELQAENERLRQEIDHDG